MEVHKITPEAHRVLQYIRRTFEDVEQQLRIRPVGIPSVQISRITGLKPSGNGRDVQWLPEDHQVTYSFPGGTKEEAWRFACVLRILSEIHSAICDNVVITKREVFYRDVALFQRQEVVDRYIDDIAHTCKVRRSYLNVIASPKGLVIGHKVDGDKHEPESIPSSAAGNCADHVKWVLVVEKEATFNTLVEQQLHLSHRLGRGVIVTARGYPDLAMRSFLRVMIDSTQFAGPTFGLFDYDAYGIDILKCYRVGSKASAGDKMLATPEMRWISVKGRDIVGLVSDTMPLTQGDRAKAQRLLEGMLLQGVPVLELADCVHELQRMLMLGRKAEIQALESEGDQLGRFLEDKMLMEM